MSINAVYITQTHLLETVFTELKHSASGSHLELCLALSFHVLLVSFVLEQYLCFFAFCDILY